MLAEIYNWFSEGFDTDHLKDAKALLDELKLLFLRIRFCPGTAENLSNCGLYELSKSCRDLDHLHLSSIFHQGRLPGSTRGMERCN
jgi:hypothetical protein